MNEEFDLELIDLNDSFAANYEDIDSLLDTSSQVTGSDTVSQTTERTSLPATESVKSQ